ncbi:MAG: SDR family oxidoreductase [Spirochaetaceae bacterium]|nr:MAG: SDR family oxidoreductase [Spirochaetaceae bacterium]
MSEASQAARVAVVTGGAQGIGRAIVRAFLDDGYDVALLDQDAEAVEEFAAEAATSRLMAISGDCADEALVAELTAGAAHRFGGVSVAVHNAGIAANGPLESLSLERWRRVLDVNLTGAFLLARAAAPWLRRSRGSIVNIASTRALMSEANTEAYSASKGGIVALTHALAVSLGPEVRVNCVSPGWIETGAHQKRAAVRPVHHSDADRAQHPVGRVGTPEDIARAVLFLADPANGFVTGQNLVIDGGMTRKMIYVEEETQ